MKKFSQKAKTEAFLALHHAPEILVLPNCWDAGSALILAEAGFPAIATTSAGIAFSRGYADGHRITRAEMSAEVKRCVDAVDIPVSADMEGGYGQTLEDVAETVRQAIAAGAIGANIEDGVYDATATKPYPTCWIRRFASSGFRRAAKRRIRWTSPSSSTRGSMST